MQARLQSLNRGYWKLVTPSRVKVKEIVGEKLTDDDAPFLELAQLNATIICACNWQEVQHILHVSFKDWFTSIRAKDKHFYLR